MNIEIANRLVELRKKNGLSQEELASKLGLSRQAVSKWERAESSPDTDNLICLAKLYNCSLDELLSTEESVEEIVLENKNRDNSDDEDVIDIEKSGNKIHIDSNGMNIEKNGKKIHISAVAMDNKSIQELSPKSRNLLNAIDSLVILVTVAAYILMGVYMDLWHPGWIIFLGAVSLMSLAEAILYKSFNKFALPVLVTGIYLLLGCLGGWWHPGWIVFLLIPVYYSFVPFITITKTKSKKEE